MSNTKLIGSINFFIFNIHLNFILITFLCIFTKVSHTQFVSQTEFTDRFNNNEQDNNNNNIQNSVIYLFNFFLFA